MSKLKSDIISRCQVCGRSIMMFTDKEKEYHVNQCLDLQQKMKLMTTIPQKPAKSFSSPVSILNYFNTKAVTPNPNQSTRLCEKRKITDFFSTTTSTTASQPPTKIQRGNKQIKHKTAPSVKKMPGCDFIVDGFGYCSELYKHYFLSHFHSDHYGSLTGNFQYGTIYCSSITSKLVEKKLNVPYSCLQPLLLNKKYIIDNIEVVCLDANHCPGSLVFLFKLPDDRYILHTGDFRYTPSMLENPFLLPFTKDKVIDKLYLDTTYLNPEYEFPSQEEIVKIAKTLFQKHYKDNKCLILFGSYTIGKEKIYLDIMKEYNVKMYVNKWRYDTIKSFNLPKEIFNLFTTDINSTNCRVTSMNNVGMNGLMKMSQYVKKYDKIIGFAPTGWCYDKNNKNIFSMKCCCGDRVICYELPYSEHSSFPELIEFLNKIHYKSIIPTVSCRTTKTQLELIEKHVSKKE